MKPRHFLDIDDHDSTTLRAILNNAHASKQIYKPKNPNWPRPALGYVLAMMFEKTSTRTRVSFDVAMRQLGGETLMLNHNDMQLGRGESIADTARVLARYVDAIMLRTGSHQKLLDLAHYANIPVINGLSDRSHPCQILADVMTLEEKFGDLNTVTVAWVGDHNNVSTSWIHAAVRFGFSFRMATPSALRPPQSLIDWTRAEGADLLFMEDPAEAVRGCQCVVTDVWVSMGQDSTEARLEMLRPYQVNKALMEKAASNAIFMHCLPANRENEVTGEVIDGPQSVVFDEAENRLHAQRAILAWCLEKI